MLARTNSPLRTLIKKSKWALILYTVAHSQWVRSRFRRGRIDSITGSTFSQLSIPEAVRVINRNLNDYLLYSDWKLENFRGKTVLEGGPGDNVGVPLRLLANEATFVATLDKFYPIHDPGHQRKIYLALREALPESERRLFDEAIKISDKDFTLDESKLKCIYGHGLEEADQVFEKNFFDVIISRGVIQEIFDTDRVFEAMDNVLKPGGIMMHKIDLRDYGIFSSNGHHPLTFLTISDPVYHWMASQSNRPSRKTVDYYYKKVAEYGYEASFFVTTVTRMGYPKPPIEVLPHKKELTLGVDYTQENLDLVHSIRPHLAPQFRKLSDDELLTAGIFLVIRKKG